MRRAACRLNANVYRAPAGRLAISNTVAGGFGTTFCSRCAMYYVKKYLLLSIGWFYSGWGQYCFYGKRAFVLRDGKEVGGMFVIDKQIGSTVILCDDGVIQRGGVYRPA